MWNSMSQFFPNYWEFSHSIPNWEFRKGSCDTKVVAVAYRSSRLRELFITEFKWQVKRGFTMLVATRAGHLWEWLQGAVRALTVFQISLIKGTPLVSPINVTTMNVILTINVIPTKNVIMISHKCIKWLTINVIIFQPQMYVINWLTINVINLTIDVINRIQMAIRIFQVQKPFFQGLSINNYVTLFTNYWSKLLILIHYSLTGMPRK